VAALSRLFGSMPLADLPYHPSRFAPPVDNDPLFVLLFSFIHNLDVDSPL
jgi:hypothetical protein